jgi:hypothetical protein
VTRRDRRCRISRGWNTLVLRSRLQRSVRARVHPDPVPKLGICRLRHHEVQREDPRPNRDPQGAWQVGQGPPSPGAHDVQWVVAVRADEHVQQCATADRDGRSALHQGLTDSVPAARSQDREFASREPRAVLVGGGHPSAARHAERAHSPVGLQAEAHDDVVDGRGALAFWTCPGLHDTAHRGSPARAPGSRPRPRSARQARCLPRRRILRGPQVPVIRRDTLRGAPKPAQPASMVSARQTLDRTSRNAISDSKHIHRHHAQTIRRPRTATSNATDHRQINTRIQ